jgi:hypothetical protein
MIELRKAHYSQTKEVRENQEKQIVASSKKGELTLNPVLGMSRHLILYAAFNGAPMAALKEPLENQEQYWPNKSEFDKLVKKEEASEQKWMESWYHEAVTTSSHYEDWIALDFSHAYAAFYFTLLHLEGEAANATLREEARNALESINAEKVVTQYAKEGFYGIYELVAKGGSGKALEHLRKAAAYSSISGNRFAMIDLLFVCCHAVAAAREGDEQHLKPEVDYYLKEAKKLARKIGYPFYFGLHEAACAEVSKIRECTVRAQGQINTSESMVGKDKTRILRIFRDAVEASDV